MATAFPDYWAAHGAALLASLGVSGGGGGGTNTTTTDPWNPITTVAAKAARTLTIDYTFGSAATPLLATATAITDIASLNTLFWNMLSYQNPTATNNGTESGYHNEWQSYNGTTNMSFNPTDLQMQCRVNAAVTTNTQVANLQQDSTTNVNVATTGVPYTWTIATGLDWVAGDPIKLSGGAGGGFSEAAYGDGTITAYNSVTGALTVTMTRLVSTGTGGSVGNPWHLTRAMITAPIIRSKNTFLYGYIEGMIWTPPGQGFIPQFWLFPSDASKFGGTESEIDIFEQLAGNTARGLDGTFSWVSGRQQAINDSNFTSDDIKPYFDLRNATQMNGGNFSRGMLLWQHPNFDVTTGFHKYAALWCPGYVTFYIDDFPFVVFSHSWKTVDGPLSDFAQIYLNFAVGISGVNFAGRPAAITDFPANLRVQYIRVWQSASEIAMGDYIHSLSQFNQILGGVSLISNWTTRHETLTPLAVANPAGTITAATLTEDAVFNFHDISQDITLSSLTTYTYSFKVRQGVGTRYVGIQAYSWGFVNGVIAIFNPSTGALATQATQGAATILSASSTPLAGGYYQIWVTFSLTTESNNTIHFYLGMYNGPNTADNFYGGDGASTVYLYDPHVLTGTTP